MPFSDHGLDNRIGGNTGAVDTLNCLGPKDGFKAGAVKGADSVLDDVKVRGELAKVRVHLCAPFTQLENSIFSSA